MIDFNILHGLSTELFLAPEVVNPNLIIEEGCWYLCTDTAELYLGVKNDTTGEFALKKINHAEEAIDPSVIELLNVEINKVKESLNDYAKKADIPDVSNFITEAEVEAKGYLTEQDIDSKADKAHTHTLTEITDYKAPDFAGYATEEYVGEQIAGIKIPSLDGYAKVSDIPTNVSQLNNDAGYITDISSKADVSHKHDDLYDAKGAAEAIKNELLNGAGDAYNTLKELGDLINNNQDAIEALTTIAAGKADKEHNHSEYLTEHQDISHLATKAELPDVSKFITDIPEEYVTEEELTAKGYLTEHQDLSNYALKSDIPTDYLKEIPAEYITETDLEAKGYITAHQDLSDYAKKSDIPTDYIKAIPDEYITESELAEELAKIEHPTVDLKGYATETWVTEQGFLKSVPDEFITADELAKEGFIKEHQSLDNYALKSDLDGKANVEHTHESYAAKEHAHPEYAEVEHTHDEYLTEHIDISGKSDIGHKHTLSEITDYAAPSLDGYATEQYVIDAIANQVPVESLAKKEEIVEVKTKLETEVLPTIQETILPTVQELAEKAATQAWVNEQGFLKEHQSLEDYAKKADIPSIEGLATEDFVRSEIENIDIPTVDTSNLVTTEILNNVLATKADEVPFKTAKFVKNPIGGFIAGEDVKGLTVAELFAKLLGLTNEPGENPDDPAEPTPPGEDATPAEIVEYLIDTETSMYSQDAQGNLVETPFAAIVWTSDEASVKMDGISTIYHIKDASGNIIESGYQEATDYNEEAWLTIALPTIVTSFKIKQYDGLRNGWYNVQFEMVKAEEQTIEGYTIWTVPEKYVVMSGSTYRFVIE